MSLSQDCMDFGRSSESLEVTESLKVGDLEADLLDPCYFNLAVWGSDGYRYRAPIRDGKLRRRARHEFEGVTMQGVRTRGLGACGLDAMLGEFTCYSVGEVELACINVRERVAAALPHSSQQVTGQRCG